MTKNNALKYLDLTSNKLTANAMRNWHSILGRTGLIHLDFSNNSIEDQGTLSIVKGLSFGPDNTK